MIRIQFISYGGTHTITSELHAWLTDVLNLDWGHDD